MKTSFFNTLSLWVLPGLIAGVVFLAIAMGSGALSTTAWAMPDAIAQVLGIAAPTEYSFAPVPVLVGVAVHLAFSIVLGIMLVAFARGLRLHGWMLVVGAVILVTIETPIALWVVMHNLLPSTTFTYYLAAVPLWGSLLGHYMYALTLGLLLARNPLTATWKLQRPASRLGTRG